MKMELRQIELKNKILAKSPTRWMFRILFKSFFKDFSRYSNCSENRKLSEKKNVTTPFCIEKL